MFRVPISGLFRWRQFEPEVILLAVGWYLRFSLSYRDVEELLAERGLHADHVTVWRSRQRYAPEVSADCDRGSDRPMTVGGLTLTYIRVKGPVHRRQGPVFTDRVGRDVVTDDVCHVGEPAAGVHRHGKGAGPCGERTFASRTTILPPIRNADGPVAAFSMRSFFVSMILGRTSHSRYA
jgi:hypothetical protein